jgi:hypothetical protein
LDQGRASEHATDIILAIMSLECLVTLQLTQRVAAAIEGDLDNDGKSDSQPRCTIVLGPIASPAEALLHVLLVAQVFDAGAPMLTCDSDARLPAARSKRVMEDI